MILYRHQAGQTYMKRFDTKQSSSCIQNYLVLGRTWDGATFSPSYFDSASLVEGIVFGSGQHGLQELPIEAVGNTWWPCILSNHVQIPWIWVRCEPLILDGSCPWKTHISRVRVFDGAGNPIPIGLPSPQPPPPATAPPPPAWLISSTVQIEELEEETFNFQIDERYCNALCIKSFHLHLHLQHLRLRLQLG